MGASIVNSLAPDLAGIPETMLWTLHNRASEAARPDGVIRDELALQIYRSLHYDYVRSFGPPDGSHGIRSALFDAELRGFLAAHPDGVIVNLGEGLETQRFRVDSESALWLSVDVPEAMAVRERYIQPDARPGSGLDGSGSVRAGRLCHGTGAADVFHAGGSGDAVPPSGNTAARRLVRVRPHPRLALAQDAARLVEDPALPHAAHALGHWP